MGITKYKEDFEHVYLRQQDIPQGFSSFDMKAYKQLEPIAKKAANKCFCYNHKQLVEAGFEQDDVTQVARIYLIKFLGQGGEPAPQLVRRNLNQRLQHFVTSAKRKATNIQSSIDVTSDDDADSSFSGYEQFQSLQPDSYIEIKEEATELLALCRKAVKSSLSQKKHIADGKDTIEGLSVKLFMVVAEDRLQRQSRMHHFLRKIISASYT